VAFSRRKFLATVGMTAAGITMVSPLQAFYAKAAHGMAATGTGFGPLEPKLPINTHELAHLPIGDFSNQPLLALPRGFNYKAISITSQTMSDGTSVPAGHDGMAAFRGPRNSTILVRNHELRGPLPTGYNYPVVGANRYSEGANGGTTTIVVGRNREVIKDFVSLAGTSTNCAGGPTPWGSWLTCEETFSTTLSNGTNVKHGYVFEVVANPNSGIVTAEPIIEMGRFSHEAVAVDPRTGFIYETEDRGDSCFYRYTPNSRIRRSGRLIPEGGSLWALKIKRGPQNTTNNATMGAKLPQERIAVGQSFDVEWVEVEDVDPSSDTIRTTAQSQGAAIFYRGEGCWYGNGLVYFVATQAGPPADGNTPGSGGVIRGNGQVWAYDPARMKLTLVVEAASSGELLDEPDNVTVTPFGDLFLCEDSSDDFQYIVGVNEDGELYQFAKNILTSSVSGFIGNEFAGACFSPDGQTFFVNIQTPGITFAIWGPWSRRGR